MTHKLTAKKIPLNKKFIGRQYELNQLGKISHKNESAIIVTHGRRRVGKTELLEQAYRNRNVLKFEGIEGMSQKEQLKHVMWQFSEYSSNPLLARVVVTSWTEFFKLIADEVKQGVWTLYFEELQWLAGYSDRFIAELKFFWDNYFRHNHQLIMILCGSSPSFMIDKVLHSKSLYNRSVHEIALREFNLAEIARFLSKKSNREVMDAYLSVGGIPEYLKWVKTESSVFTSLCQNAFTANSFFSHEYERIFTSSLAANRNYQKIIEFLSRQKHTNRNQILKHLKLKSGGTLTNLLTDLEICGFIKRYTPYNLNSSSRLARYSISDQYLQFYFKFIQPIADDIDEGNFNQNPMSAVNTASLGKWLGFAFERMCRNKHRLIAKILGFESVRYRSGTFFNRATDQQQPGYQLDLLFERDDRVITVCEVKYLQSKVTAKVIEEFEQKLALFPNSKINSIHKVLITSQGAADSLINKGYFDRIVTLDDIFQAAV